VEEQVSSDHKVAGRVPGSSFAADPLAGLAKVCVVEATDAARSSEATGNPLKMDRAEQEGDG
jgi:hypothetical protein